MVIIRHNWPIKLASLVMAVVLAFYVQKQAAPGRRTLYAPVEVPVPLGLRVVAPGRDAQIRVDLSGSADVLRGIEPKDLRVEVAAGPVRPGSPRRVPVSVELAPEIRGQASVANWSPRTLWVEVVKDTVITRAVVLRPLNRPSGWEWLEPPTAAPAEVTITGPASVVEQVARVSAEFQVEETARMSLPAAVSAWDRAGRDVTDQIRIQPNQVLVTGTQQQVLLQKRVPVTARFTIAPNARPVISVVPQQVQIVGPERAVADIHYVETEPIDLAEASKVRRQQVRLVPPVTGLQLLPTEVTIGVKLSKPQSPTRPAR